MQVTINTKDFQQVNSINIGFYDGRITVGFGEDATAYAEPILGAGYIAPMVLPMKTLDHLSWADVDRISKLPNVREYFALGARKKDYMKNGFVAEWQIIGFDHDDLADGSGKACLSWDMVRVYKERIQMNADWDNEGGWESCKANKYAHEEFLPQCSDELQAIILPVIKLTSEGGGSTEIIKSVCKVWLKSEKELFGRCIWSAPGEGRWYEYYMQEDIPYYKEDDEGSRRWNWLRSPDASNSTNFCFVNSGGTSYSSAAYIGNYISFGFCSGRR